MRKQTIYTNLGKRLATPAQLGLDLKPNGRVYRQPRY